MSEIKQTALRLLELRSKATQGEWTNSGDIYIFANDKMVADVNDDAAVLRARGVGGGMSIDQQVSNLSFCVDSANHIESIIKWALEMEKENTELKGKLESVGK